LSSRDIEDLLAERGIAVSYESIRLWCIKFGSKFAKRLKRRDGKAAKRFFKRLLGNMLQQFRRRLSWHSNMFDS
jgi:transposase-like protein